MAKKYCKIKRKQRLVEREHTYGEKVYDWCNDRKCKFTAYDESDAGYRWVIRCRMKYL